MLYKPNLNFEIIKIYILLKKLLLRFISFYYNLFYSILKYNINLNYIY
jgi:hypothetical protein